MADNFINGVVLTFFSTASSVGKTLISVNMAAELARQGFHVCLVDFDLQFGDVANYLKLPPEDNSLTEVISFLKNNPEGALAEAISNYQYGGVNFDVIPAPERLEDAYNLDVSDCRLVITRLQSMYDYVVIDTTSMFSVLNLAMLDMSTIVTFLGVMDFIPTIKNMKIGNDTLRELNYDIHKIRLVLNRGDSNTSIAVGDVEPILGESFYHILPNDFKSASESITTGVPLVLSGKNSILAKEIHNLILRYTNVADRTEVERPSYVADEPEYVAPQEKKNEGGWFSKLFG